MGVEFFRPNRTDFSLELGARAWWDASVERQFDPYRPTSSYTRNVPRSLYRLA